MSLIKGLLALSLGASSGVDHKPRLSGELRCEFDHRLNDKPFLALITDRV